MYKTEVRKLHAQIEAELDADYKQRQDDLDLILQQRIHALEAEKNHTYIEELQKVRVL